MYSCVRLSTSSNIKLWFTSKFCNISLDKVSTIQFKIICKWYSGYIVWLSLWADFLHGQTNVLNLNFMQNATHNCGSWNSTRKKMKKKKNYNIKTLEYWAQEQVCLRNTDLIEMLSENRPLNVFFTNRSLTFQWD